MHVHDREGLITFGCPHVHDIVLFRRPDDTFPQGFVPPHVTQNIGEEALYILELWAPPFPPTLNGQTDNIFHRKPVI